jgi:hypothetical protein
MNASVKIILGISIAVLMMIGTTALCFFGWQYDVSLTESQIKTAIDKKFPLVKKHLKVFEVTYSNPTVILETGSDKVKVSLDAVAHLLLEKAQLRGSAIATTRVAYDKSSGAFYLEDATIESLKIPGLSEKWAKIAAELGTLGTREYLNRYPVYRLKQSDFKQNLAKCLLKDVKIMDKKLVLTLGLGD